MATTKAQQKATMKYMKNNIDRFYIISAKGKKDFYKQIASEQGKSLNQFILDCVDKWIDENYSKSE